MISQSKIRWLKEQLLQYGALLGVLAFLLLTFGRLSDSFFTATTARLIANQIPSLTVVSVGMTLVLIVGGIDLSVGSLLALSSSHDSRV